VTWRSSVSLLVRLLLAVPVSGTASAKVSAKWMAHCAGNLKSSGLKARSVRTYCACMDGLVDEAEMLALRQIELERTYPPAHLNCYKKGGWK
jgi:hypothetical protein